jgi:hypothetical protein
VGSAVLLKTQVLNTIFGGKSNGQGKI